MPGTNRSSLILALVRVVSGMAHEFRITCLPAVAGTKTIAEHLQEMSLQGWDFCTTAPADLPETTHYFFRRPYPNTSNMQPDRAQEIITAAHHLVRHYRNGVFQYSSLITPQERKNVEVAMDKLVALFRGMA